MTQSYNEPYRRGSYHLIYNLDGSFRGYEWAQLDERGRLKPSRVYAQEGRDENGRLKPTLVERIAVYSLLPT